MGQGALSRDAKSPTADTVGLGLDGPMAAGVADYGGNSAKGVCAGRRIGYPLAWKGGAVASTRVTNKEFVMRPSGVAGARRAAGV